MRSTPPTFKPFIPEEAKYDGFGDYSSELCARTHFELRPASDMILFPFSRYPKKAPRQSPVKLISLDACFLLDSRYALFYVATTPTQFGQSFKTVFQTHVAVVVAGSKEEKFVTAADFQRLDKRSNQVFSFSSDDKATFAVKVTLNEETYAHNVVLGFLGGLACPTELTPVIESGVKLTISKEKFECPVETCHAAPNSLAGLKAHYISKHSDVKEFSCDICGKEFSTHQRLASHTDGVHGDVQFECQSCRKSFRRKADFLRHVVVNHKRELLPYPCEYENCAKSFMTKHERDSHVSGVHKQERSHKCQTCEKQFSSKTNLTRHVAAVHQRLRKYHTCVHCNRNFQSKSSLEDHVAIAHRGEQLFRCESCDRNFTSKVGLQKHVDAVHLRLKPHKCDECEKCFSTKTNLNQHVKNVHRGTKSHLCDVCPKSFPTKSKLKRHVSSVHEKSKPFRCGVCNKTFTEKGNLLQHAKNVHKGVKDHAGSKNL